VLVESGLTLKGPKELGGGGWRFYEHVECRNGNDDLLRYADTSMISCAYV
jgi:hypothetical protein